MEVGNYVSYDAIGIADLIRRREVSAEEVMRSALSAMERVNPQIGAVIESWDDEVPSSGAASPLAGVPFLIKDVGIAMAGRRSEAGSRLAAGYVSPVDSALMERFRRAGLVTIGRTATPEFAISTTTEPLSSRPTRNPWDPSRSAGGSSGGSCAAVAAGITPLAHGTDASGSIRVPAAATGLVGLKPTRGRVSNGPSVDEIWSGLAVQGGVSRTVRDSAALLDAAAVGAVGEPYYTASPEEGFLANVGRAPGPLSIGLQLHPLDGSRSAPSVAEAARRAALLCESLGHRVTEVTSDIGVSWDAFVQANGVFCGVGTAAWAGTIASGLGRPMDGTTMEPPTLAMCAFGRKLSALDLQGALNVRNIVTRSVGAFFERFDVLLTPTLPELPLSIGDYNAGWDDLDGPGWVGRVFSRAPFTPLANIAGVPALSLPLDVDHATGLPIGIQFTAGFGREDVLFRIAGQLEQASPWIARKPTVWAGASG